MATDGSIELELGKHGRFEHSKAFPDAAQIVTEGMVVSKITADHYLLHNGKVVDRRCFKEYFDPREKPKKDK